MKSLICATALMALLGTSNAFKVKSGLAQCSPINEHTDNGTHEHHWGTCDFSVMNGLKTEMFQLSHGYKMAKPTIDQIKEEFGQRLGMIQADYAHVFDALEPMQL